MLKITLKDIAEHLIAYHPNLDVRLSRDDFNGLVVFPPADSQKTLGVEIYIHSHYAAIWFEGKVVEKVRDLSSPSSVANSIVKILSA